MKSFREYIITEGLKFGEELIGAHSGQHDLKLTAYDGSKLVGYIDFSLLNGAKDVPYINYVFVDPNERGKGIGPQLVKALAKEYPYTNWQRGMLTNQGSKLMAKMDLYFEPFIKRGRDEWGNDLVLPKATFNYHAHVDHLTNAEILQVAPDYDGWSLHMEHEQFLSFSKYAKLRHLKAKLAGDRAVLTSGDIVQFLKDVRDSNFEGVDVDDWNNLNDLGRVMFQNMQDQ